MEKNRKRLRLNSIKDPQIKRILRPCEARAGHGAISIFIGLTVIFGAFYALIGFIKWAYKYFTS